MEHEVFVPVSAEPLRRVLANPATVVRAVPGLQQDAGGAPLAGRLKVRVGGSSITYRGTLRVAEQDDGTYTFDGEAAEARGSGTVQIALTLRLATADGGTTLVFGGSVTGDGRFAELDPGVAATAGRRLLNRFAESVAAAGAGGEPSQVSGADGAEGADGSGASGPSEVAGAAEVTDAAETSDVAGSEGEAAAAAWADGASQVGAEKDDKGSDEESDEDDVVELPVVEAGGPVFEVDNEPPAEAAHARRTMIGRSAEEVDHAPPRGRYAPVPAPTALSASATLRWAAPAAALVLASAIVIGRALRRRR